MSESKIPEDGPQQRAESAFREGEEDPSKAPFELMAQFLLLVNQRQMTEALELSHQILQYEPNNQLVIEYQKTLRRYIRKAIEEAKAGDEVEGQEGEYNSDADSSRSSDTSSSGDSSSGDSSSGDSSGGASTDSEESVEAENRIDPRSSALGEPKRSALRDMYAFEKK